MLNISVLKNLVNLLGNQMRNLIIVFISLVFFTYPLFADSIKQEILYGWETSNGIQLRKFGEKAVHPIYEGDSENKQPNGLGIMTFPDGKKYLGQWKDGKKHGNGTLTHPNGIKFVGEWEEGKMWNVIKYDAEGKFVGEILDGKVWNGIVYDNNGNFLGRWFNGKLQK